MMSRTWYATLPVAFCLSLFAQLPSQAYQLTLPFDPSTQNVTVVRDVPGIHCTEADVNTVEVYKGRIFYCIRDDGSTNQSKVYACEPHSGSNVVILASTNRFVSLKRMGENLYLSHTDGRL